MLQLFGSSHSFFVLFYLEILIEISIIAGVIDVSWRTLFLLEIDVYHCLGRPHDFKVCLATAAPSIWALAHERGCVLERCGY